jgi:YaiO family outer membrane protein
MILLKPYRILCALGMLFLGCSLRAQTVKDTTKFDAEKAFRLAQTTAWAGKYAEASQQLHKLLRFDKYNADAWVLLSRVKLWNNEPDSVLALVNKAADAGAEAHEIQYIECQALMLLKRYSDVLKITSIFTTSAKNERTAPFFKIEKQAERFLMKTHFAVSAEITAAVFTDKTQFLDIESLEFQQKLSKDAFVLRGSLGQRFGLKGRQIEGEYYRNFSSKSYAQFQASVSNGRVFADWQGGATFYKSFKAGFETNVSARYMQFDTTWVTLWGLGFGKQVGQLGFGLNFTQSFSNAGNGQVINLPWRYYASDPDSYTWGSLGFGNTLPNYQQFQGVFDGNLRVLTRFIALGRKQVLAKNWLIDAGFYWEQFKRNEIFKQNRYTLRGALYYRF